MSAPKPPNPEAVPLTALGGRMRPEWVRYIATLLAHIDALEARIRALEAP